ncbi:AMP-binding protein [Clostridium pasteurianum]|uniref:AMP-binding protein n=1 Tax=Clostridium pasteurianum TaxID=1501 RepID=UPI001FA7496E|nr:AMP-binding protein [Clostridium pasteurianum]
MFTLAESLIKSAESSFKRGVFLIKGENQEKYISYKDIYNKAVQVLYNLQACGLKPGDELILQIKEDENEQFIYTFWACILGKIIPVPVSVTYKENRSKVLKIFSQLKSPKIIIDEKCLKSIDNYAKDTSFEKVFKCLKDNSISMEEVIKEEGIGVVQDIKPEDIAFIQFSSGTTGDSKGVVLTHKNLLTNIVDIIKGFKGNDEDVTLSWMPLAHDMGIIGFHLMPLVLNVDQCLMPTTLFIRNPVLWIKKVNEHRATIIAASNFGFRYFLDNLKDKEYPEWDLSCVRKVFNGAEPISVDIINEFLNKLSRYNLKRVAMYPVYGMADASLAVAFPPADEEFSCVYVRRDSLGVGQDIIELKKDEDSELVMELVVEGYSVRNCTIRIVDDNGNALDEGKLGHIQISGGNVTGEYYNNPELTKKIIDKDGWLSTGDLGFIKNRRIVVIGRATDIIRINGITYYPHYIEKKCEKIEGIVSGRIVVCGLKDKVIEKEKLIIFLRFKKKIEDFLALAEDVKEIIKEQVGINVDEIIPIRSIPKTTSGKIQRFKLVEMYKKGEFNDIIDSISAILSTKTLEEVSATKDS